VSENQEEEKTMLFHLSSKEKTCPKKIILIGILGIFLLCGQLILAQMSEPLKYQMPPEPIADIVDAPPTPEVSIDPTNQWLLILQRPNLSSIEELAQPELRLAGIRINPRTNGRSRGRYYIDLKMKSISTEDEFSITGLPENPRIQYVRWSPDGKHIALTITDKEGIYLWIADTESRTARQLIPSKLNGTVGSPFQWLSDNSTLICKALPEDRGEPPIAPETPANPVIEETTGKKAPARTYQDLLKDPHDEALFEYYCTSRLVRVGIDGSTSELGVSGIIRNAEPSPNGKYILVETIHRPFSYRVPIYRFPYKVEVRDADGKLVKQIADLPLAEEVPIGFDAVPKGPRYFDWRADAPATLYWAEAQDDGDPNKEAEIRDRVYMLPAPFTKEPIPLVSLGLRFDGIEWADGNLALADEFWWKTRQIRTWIIKPNKPKAKPTLLFDRSYEDRYSDPGRPVTKQTSQGTSVLFTVNKGKSFFLMGRGASPEGNRPFLDRFDVNTSETKRLWQSEAPYYERGVMFIDEKGFKFLTSRESITEPPNYFVRDWLSGDLAQLTHFPHPTPMLKDAQKELIKYTRDDGVQLMGTLYLPPDYNPESGPLPTILWAYPREFKSAQAAGQVTTSPYQFIRVSWGRALPWLTMGYAILDGPTMPIIGEGAQEPNDTYVEQLVASARAAVDELVRRGVTDPDRIAIGGHSYGAFMAANLLAHSDLFAAGIARSGAYNRTLTPFGFQAEERTYWEAPEVYHSMSPFMHADKVNEPILLIHGAADNNSGTFPVQSQRFFHALKGHGAVARLVMLPYESHGYRARESIMHALWEMTEWLEKYVKNKKDE
jgi:dipeptidyl aminopeptidase/acylaminoacyl peptidase